MACLSRMWLVEKMFVSPPTNEQDRAGYSNPAFSIRIHDSNHFFPKALNSWFEPPLFFQRVFVFVIKISVITYEWFESNNFVLGFVNRDSNLFFGVGIPCNRERIEEFRFNYWHKMWLVSCKSSFCKFWSWGIETSVTLG